MAPRYVTKSDFPKYAGKEVRFIGKVEGKDGDAFILSSLEGGAHRVYCHVDSSSMPTSQFVEVTGTVVDHQAIRQSSCREVEGSFDPATALQAMTLMSYPGLDRVF
eukprot:GDKH01016057.1.p1 GENE.GDKH01016057.1~~GDKH01016057.1.p1  ORF type:complete len:106 (-),score=17.78 GDKH01016057.1:212-529(-)